MKKKILAGVVSLLMVAAAMPMTEIANFIPSFGITASAATSTTVTSTDGYYNMVVSESAHTIVVSLTSLFSDTYNYDSRIEFKFDSAKETLATAGYSDLSEYTVILNGSFKTVTSTVSPIYPSLSNVVFSDNFVNVLGSSIFSGCTNLQTMVFSDSITTLGSNAFLGCTNFAGDTSNNTISLNKITSIGSSAFSGCKTLVGVNFNSNTTDIGANAFTNCTKLLKVSLPATVKTIGASAFSGCTSLSEATFEKNSVITSLGASAFSGCTALTTVNANETSNTLPHSLSSVGVSLFNGCTALNSFVIPNTLTAVSNSMFNGCKKLSSLIFEENSICKSVGSTAFQSCTSLTSIETPTTTTAFGLGAFNGCTTLSKVVVSDSLDTLGESCFGSCYVLSLYPASYKSDASANPSKYANKVVMTNVIKTIPKGCFQKCSGITSVDLRVDTGSIDEILDYAFDNCTSLPNIAIPQAVINIGNYVFRNCTSLKDVTLSDNLKTILTNAFQKCSSLETITPFSATKYDYTVQFPASCGGVQANGFEGCTSIKYLNFLKDENDYSNFAVVGSKSFLGCTGIIGSCINGTSSRTLEFPTGVVVVQGNAFQNCSGLDMVVFMGNVTSVGDYAFNGCSGLTTVKMNPTVQSIGTNAFQDCKALENLPVTFDGKTSALTQLDLLNNYVFSGCIGLKNIEIPGNIKSINQFAFQNCSGLETVKINNSNLATIGNSAFVNCKSLKTISTDVTKAQSVIPACVSTIGNSAFASTAFTSVKFDAPSGDPTTIGTNAFESCTALNDIDLSATNLSVLSNYTFTKCTAMKSVKLPSSLRTISANAFRECNKLSCINSTTTGEYNIPEGVVTIGDEAFYNNHNMSNFIIPSTATSISHSAWNFSLRYKQEDIANGTYNPIKSFTVSSSNPNYSSEGGVLFNKDKTELYMYPTMKSGTSYTIPSTVTDITNSAFASNDNITKVTLNANLQSIEQKAFSGCESLKSIVFGGNQTVVLATNSIVGTSSKPVYLSAKAGSTAETYAGKTSNVTFIDNALEASSITISEGSSMECVKADKTQQLTAVIKTASGAAATDVVKWSTSDTSIATVDDNGKVSFRTLGKVTITATTSAGLSDSIVLNVVESIPAVISGVNASYTYTGSKIIPNPTVKIGAKTLTKNTDYTLTYSGNTNVGTATITITFKGSYSGSTTKTFKITQKSLTGATATVASAKYTGSALKPTVTVKSGSKTLKNGTDYTVTYKNNINKGTATATITGKGNYSGTLSKSFTISAKSVSTLTIGSISNKIYTGKALKPAVSIKNGTKVLVSGTDYTITYLNNTNIGKASVKITGKGNYSGTKTVTFKINPATQTIKKLSALSKGFTVKWVKNSKVTGYQIQYSTSSKFTSAKTVTIRSASTYYKSIKSLSKSKKYYVRVRAYKTIGSTNYYSKWSGFKSVTTK